MKNPHITFEPSTIIQSRRFGCQTVSGITARELLRPNAFIYQPKSSFTISPYDIGNNSFSPSKTLPYGEEDLYNNPNSTDTNISIDNYDPRIPTNFTDSLTLTAIKNLGIQSSDLFFPTNAILDKINGDKRYYETLLIERAHKYREEVKKERQRIIEAASNDYLNRFNNVYSDYEKIINSNSPNYFRKRQIQRPSTGLNSSKSSDALEKAKIITELQSEDSQKQDNFLKDFQFDKNNEIQIHIDIFDDKRKRPSILTQARDDYVKTEDREINKRKKDSINIASRPSSRKVSIRSSLGHRYTLKSADSSVNEQKNATFLD